MSGMLQPLVGKSGLGGKTGLGNVGNGVLGAMFDPANFSGLFGNNQGPGAFLNPGGSGGSFWPGGPGLPGGNKTGGAINDAVATILGGEFLGPLVGGSSLSSADIAGASDAFPGPTATASDFASSGSGATAGSGGSGIMSLMNSPIAGALVNQGGSFLNSKTQPGQPVPNPPPPRPAATPPPSVGPQANMQANPQALLTNYVNTIRSLAA